MTAQRTSGIRPLHPSDLPSVVELHEKVIRPDRPRPSAATIAAFRRTFVDGPWTDPEIPPLVFESAHGDIVGFLGSNVRRMRLDGRSIRVACSSNLVASPDPGARGAGAMLTRAYLQGPQELTMADCATEEMRRLWTGLRGQTLMHASMGWSMVFRPLGALDALARRTASSGPVGRAVGTATRPADRLIGRVPLARKYLVPPRPAGTSELLTSSGLVEHVGLAARALRLHPDYDERYLDWLFAEITAIDPRGRLVRRLVRDPSGRALGWYVYLLPHRGIAQVLQVHALGTGVERVFAHLVRHAWEAGAVALQGRVEPVLAPVLAARRCVLSPTAWVLVESADPTLLALLGSPRSLLSRLDGEWWLGHHLWRDDV